MSLTTTLTIILLIICIGQSGPQPMSLGIHFVRSPESAVAPIGDEVVFDCELNLKPDHLEWRFRAYNEPINTKRYGSIQENVTNEERSTKIRIFVSSASIGDYHCVGWIGSVAIASTSAHLTLVSIEIENKNMENDDIISYNVAPKNYVIIRCGNVLSNPPASWTFYHNGNRIYSPEVLSSNSGAIILNLVSAKDSGIYTCVATNGLTTTELILPRKIDLHVTYSDRTAPYFLEKPPSKISAQVGENILLECPGLGSPPPEAVWSSPNVANIYKNRSQILPYGLIINYVLPEDQGSYICRLDNGIAPVVVHTIHLNVLERPKIHHGPSKIIINEGESLDMFCSVSGNPIPDVFWLINGDNAAFDNDTSHDGSRLKINHVKKHHAGIIQCFARNELGEVSHGSLLQVKPTQITGDVDNELYGNINLHLENDGSSNKLKKRKYAKQANMIPPSRPNVTRLSDTSVMLRWNVMQNVGLPIQFFKVQYRMLGDYEQTIPRENWQTTNEEIPFGKADSQNVTNKFFTSSVPGLSPGRLYRFRIIAVYSNNDNKEGRSSVKFFLQYGTELEPYTVKLPTPRLIQIEQVSNTSLRIHWRLSENYSNGLDGFYAYYRPASSAGDYMKMAIDGALTEKYTVDNLEPDTTYEFKLQSFNAFAASEFSMIRQGKTKKNTKTLNLVTQTEQKPININTEKESNYVLTAGAVGAIFIIFVLFIIIIIFLKRRKNMRPQVENKPQLANMRIDFIAASVLSSSIHNKPVHHANNVMPHINMTQTRTQIDDKETKTGHSTHVSSQSVAWELQPSIQVHQQSPNAFKQNKSHYLQQQETSDIFQHNFLSENHTSSANGPSPEYHGLLECKAINLNSRNQEQCNITSDIDTVELRRPPPRPACQTLAGHRNEHKYKSNNSKVGDMTRIQPSPKPLRTIFKRDGMGSSKINMSVGSLDSIEV